MQKPERPAWKIAPPVYSDEEIAEAKRARAAGEIREPTSFEVEILKGLQGKTVFQGPVVDNGSGSAGRRLTEAKIAQRRARGARDRHARRGRARAALRAAARLAGQKRNARLGAVLLSDPPVLRFLGLPTRQVPVEVELGELDRALREAAE